MRGVSVAPISERLEAFSIPEPNTGCRLWLGVVKRNGYGSIAIKAPDGKWKTKHAHRVSYEEECGPIPAGLDLDHKCRVRCCIEPAHLEPVTRSVNLSRSPLMSRTRTHCRRAGHPLSAKNCRGQLVCLPCAAERSRAHRTKNKEKRTPK